MGKSFKEWRNDFFAPRSKLPKGYKITFLVLEVVFGAVGIALVIYGSVNQLQTPITTSVELRDVRRHSVPPLIICGSQGVLAGLQSNSSTVVPGASFQFSFGFFVEESGKVRTPFTIITENIVWKRALLEGKAHAINFPEGSVQPFIGVTTMVLQDTAPCFNISFHLLPDVATGNDGRVRVALGFSQTLVHGGLSGSPFDPISGLIKTFGVEDVIMYWDYDLTPASDLDSASMKAMMQANRITSVSVDEEQYVTLGGAVSRKLRAETNYVRWFSDFSFAQVPSPTNPHVANVTDYATYYGRDSSSYGVLLQWKSNTVLVTKEQPSVDVFLLVGVFLTAIGSGVVIFHSVFEYVLVRQKKEIQRRSQRNSISGPSGSGNDLRASSGIVSPFPTC